MKKVAILLSCFFAWSLSIYAQDKKKIKNWINLDKSEQLEVLRGVVLENKFEKIKNNLLEIGGKVTDNDVNKASLLLDYTNHQDLNEKDKDKIWWSLTQERIETRIKDYYREINEFVKLLEESKKKEKLDEHEMVILKNAQLLQKSLCWKIVKT